MKKILAMLLALSVSCTMLTACIFDRHGQIDDESSAHDPVEDSKADDSSADTSEDSSKDDESTGDESKVDDPGDKLIGITLDIENEDYIETDERFYEAIINEIAGAGAFTYDVKGLGYMETLVMDMYLTTDSKSCYIEMSLTDNESGNSETSVILLNTEGEYMLDTEGKKYYTFPAGSFSEMDDLGETIVAQLTSFEGLSYSSTSTGTIDGDEYTIERYINTETDVKISYIFDADGNIVYVGNNDIYLPFVFSAEVDEAKLSLDEYTEMTDEEFVAWYATSSAR